VVVVTPKRIDHRIMLGKHECIYVEQELKFLGLEIKAAQIILQNHILENKIENFSKRIEDRKQLERSFRCLIYTLDFIKYPAKLRKPLQQKPKKEVRWIRIINDSKIVQNLQYMCKNLPVLNLLNEKDDLILEIDVNNKH